MTAMGYDHLRLTSLFLVLSFCGPAASVQPSIDIQENLYTGWTVINRPYQGWQAISNVKERDPDLYPNASISSGNAFGSEPATGAFGGQEPEPASRGNDLSIQSFVTWERSRVSFDPIFSKLKETQSTF